MPKEVRLLVGIDYETPRGHVRHEAGEVVTLPPKVLAAFNSEQYEEVSDGDV
jgi:hypothetical protein